MYIYDVLVKGGRIVDPGSGTAGEFDVGICGGMIAAVEKDIPLANGVRVIDAKGRIVTAGLIDLHGHVCEGITRHGINPDRAGVLQGVTTIVDGGSTGSHTFLGMTRHVLPAIRTRMLSFLNLAYSGQAWMPELRSLADLDEATTEKVMRTNRDVILGTKIRAISPMIKTIGAKVVELAKKHASTVNGSVMVHAGDHGDAGGEAPAVTAAIVEGLRPGDIMSHPYTCHPGRATTPTGEPLSWAKEAQVRGVVMDVARGMANFTIDVTRRALEAGFLPDTISSDITLMTIHGPVFGLADTASIFLNLGMSLEDVILRVTAKPAKALKMFHTLGSVEYGKRADLTILEYRQGGRYEFEGFRPHKERMTGDKILIPITTIRDGVPIPCDLPAGSAMRAAFDNVTG